jgi:hypothetical protein
LDAGIELRAPAMICAALIARPKADRPAISEPSSKGKNKGLGGRREGK